MIDNSREERLAKFAPLSLAPSEPRRYLPPAALVLVTMQDLQTAEPGAYDDETSRALWVAPTRHGLCAYPDGCDMPAAKGDIYCGDCRSAVNVGQFPGD